MLNPSSKVSVLVAARNEEANIGACLDALLAMDYPTQSFEIWVGNDQSTDRTEDIIKYYAEHFDQIYYINIEDNWGLSRGKANVLAQLAKQAKGEVFFITDADVCPNPEWIKQMLLGFKSNDVGIVNGTTIPYAQTILDYLQAMDWLLAQAIIRFLHLLGIDYTAVGNNMAITKEAYEATGGYENIPFSITEDLALHQATKASGYKLVQLYSLHVLAYTVSIKNWTELIQQRIRWMHGAATLPFWQQTPLFLQLIFLPFMVLLLSLGFSEFVIIVIGFRWVFFSIAWGMLNQWRFIFFLPAFEVYSFLLYWQFTIGFYSRKPVIWKSRSFAVQ